MTQSILSGPGFTPLPGWPCTLAQGGAPAIDDILAQPSAALLLRQVLQLTPRGPAWGTDEAGDGQGASPLQLAFWTALSAWLAEVFASAFDVLRQNFPSLVDWGLDDQAQEYGLPDKCLSESPTAAQLRTALQIKYALVGSASPDYAICLAASLGYDIFIEEIEGPLRCDEFFAGDLCYDAPWGDVFYVHAPIVTEFPLLCDSFFAGDLVMVWGNSELECAIRAAAQPQTFPIFAYDVDPEGGALDGFTLDDGSTGDGDALT